MRPVANSAEVNARTIKARTDFPAHLKYFRPRTATGKARTASGIQDPIVHKHCVSFRGIRADFRNPRLSGCRLHLAAATLAESHKGFRNTGFAVTAEGDPS